MSTPTLFPDAADRASLIDQEIALLLCGRSGGPFGLSMNDEEKAVLRAIRYHRGLGNAITIEQIRERVFGGGGRFTDREIKQIVRTLRISYHLPIGSSKHGSAGGYFIIITPDDMAAFLKGPLEQMRAEAQVVRAVAGSRATRELLGQLQMEIPCTD